MPFCALEPVETTSRPNGRARNSWHARAERLVVAEGSGKVRWERPTPICFNSDVTAIAKRAFKRGEMRDGEGGLLVWASRRQLPLSLAQNYLPLGLANGIRLNRDVAEGEPLRWSDVAFDATDPAVRVRREMERAFGRPPQ